MPVLGIPPCEESEEEVKTKRVLRYYCDFCRKGGCSKHAMEQHEKRCIKNPNRTCGFCAVEKLKQKPMAELQQAFGKGGLDGLKEVSENCPACILSAIVQSRLAHNDEYVDFDYKKAVQEFWSERNERLKRDEEFSTFLP